MSLLRQTAQQSFANVHLCVDGDGLLGTYYGSRQPIMASVVSIYLEIRHRAVAKTVIF